MTCCWAFGWLFRCVICVARIVIIDFGIAVSVIGMGCQAAERLGRVHGRVGVVVSYRGSPSRFEHERQRGHVENAFGAKCFECLGTLVEGRFGRNHHGVAESIIQKS